jgi:hypothetical protein
LPVGRLLGGRLLVFRIVAYVFSFLDFCGIAPLGMV